VSTEILTPNLRRSDATREFTEVTAAILAGGLGSRLRPAVSGRPKALANIGERPFLTYLFDQLVAAGTKDVVVCAGYLGDQIQMVFGESYDTLHLNYSRELTPLGTAGALRLALPLFNSNPVLVMNGDSYCDANIRELWFWHGSRQANATLLLTKIFDTERFGQVKVDADGKVTDFREKSSGQGPGWINAGICLLNRDLLEDIPANRPVSLERETFPAWIGRGLYGFRSEARFMDIGTPEAYADAQWFFAGGLPR
jgi:D-glycero-alpha-D-manno-heptose 1-phosphate guanylyltransferase